MFYDSVRGELVQNLGIVWLGNCVSDVEFVV